jgi:hypothetical protein
MARLFLTYDDPQYLGEETVLGRGGTRTVLIIGSDSGKDMRRHSLSEAEHKILFLLLISLKWATSPRKTEPEYSLFEPLSSLIFRTETIPSKPIASVSFQKLLMAESKKDVQVVLSAKGLTDSDMQRVIQDAIVEQQCTVLHLSYNKITHEGVSILAEALRNNTVRKILFYGFEI